MNIQIFPVIFSAILLLATLTTAQAGPGHGPAPGQPGQQRPQQQALTQKLDSEPLRIVTSRGEFEFSVEIADEPQERTIGLMNRPKMDPRAGMLFEFGRKDVITMWMKDTLIPLDMIFITDDGKVATISERTTPRSLDVISSVVPVSYVLELNGGMAAFIGLKPGDAILNRLFN